MASLVVVLTLGGAELVPTTLPLVNPTGRLLEVGWAGGPVPPASQAERVERWLRTAWPLHRFRKFARDGLTDRLHPALEDQVMPGHFASTREVFSFLTWPTPCAACARCSAREQGARRTRIPDQTSRRRHAPPAR